ncbi:hypothetical protein SDC9_59057 [bioreactor metagenome]|uniref:HEAT repeat domain-containing protein n=1 Tax=bioreactor metagenome TaxID=1076179 RepID=A0A644XEW1_9ZZZZ
MTIDSLLSIPKDKIAEAAKELDPSELPQLVELLTEKDNKIRYQAFLLLQSRSQISGDVYPFWDIFASKLASDNSYQRSIGAMLMAENAGWDTENRLEGALDAYLELLHDEKPITVRQCIQSLSKIAPHKPHLTGKIAERLAAFDFSSVPETMRKSILLDSLNFLLSVRKSYHTDQTEAFLLNALTGDLLDKKSKKQIEAALRGA